MRLSHTSQCVMHAILYKRQCRSRIGIYMCRYKVFSRPSCPTVWCHHIKMEGRNTAYMQDNTTQATDTKWLLGSVKLFTTIKAWVAGKIHGQTFIITLAGRHQDCSDVSATYGSLRYSFTAKISTVNSFLIFIPRLHLFSCPGCNESKQSKQWPNWGSKTLNSSRNTKPALRGCKSAYVTTYTKNIQNGAR